MPQNTYHQFDPISFAIRTNNMGFARLGARITEIEYLNALEIVKDYRKQIRDDIRELDKEIKELDSIDKINEKEIISKALDLNNYNRAKTANYLRLSERTLYRKIVKYGLTFENINNQQHEI